jgi:hypothetical protein
MWQRLLIVILLIGITIPVREDPCSPYTRRERISPALAATLPGQVNPFYYSTMCYKSCEEIIGVDAVAASRTNPGGAVYYPLTVVSWEHAGDVLDGTIRNDSDQSLQDLSLVATDLTYCAWRPAEITDATLEPGAETTFQFDYNQTCLDNTLLIVGQGVAQP